MTGAPIGNNPGVRFLESENNDCDDRTAEGRAMSVIDFFEYLASNDDTTELAHELADVWVAHQIVDAYEPAA